MKWLQTAQMTVVLFILLCGAAIAQQNIPVPTPSPMITAPKNTQPAPAETAPTAFVYSAGCPALMDGRIKAVYTEALSDGECGERSPLKLTEIAKPQIVLSGSPLVNCAMATRLADWAEQIDGLAKIHLGTGLKRLVTGPGYQCRRRNGAADGKISEHGFANALDVLGFELADGRKMDILSNLMVNPVSGDLSGAEPPEPLSVENQFLETAHKKACELFTTVLGPQANAAHKDHFHLDLGCHGKSCTYLVCE